MIKLDPKNGVHIYPTLFAIDRYITTDKETKKTYVHWRLLEVNRHTLSYTVVTVAVKPLQVMIDLVNTHTGRCQHFQTVNDYRKTVDELLLTCQSAIDAIQQHAAINQVRHG